ncbi:peptidyl-prolyl cis-trans isomerase [Marinicella sp. W31]|uniref:peptidylprolyl isomerase n=1 Tax=Marinicella sp. W31 TaxID=3023713 RepID=UPI0037583C35
MKIAILCLFVFLYGCQQESETTTNDTGALAQYAEIQYTAKDLESYILNLPINQRQPADVDNIDDWFVEKTHEMILQDALLREARAEEHHENLEFKNKQRDLYRRLHSQKYLAQFPPPPELTEADLQSYYESEKARFQLPEKRNVFHLFKRIDANQTELNVRTQLKSLRDRILAGESFQLVARDHSDSESRHKSGFIGQIKKGQISTDFDQLIFELDINQPSEIVKTADGYHMFMVSDIFVQKDYPLSSVRELIRKELTPQQMLSHLREKAEQLPKPEQVIKPSESTFRQRIMRSASSEPLLQVNDYQLSVAQFKVLLENIQSMTGPSLPTDFPFQLAEEIFYQEMIYQSAPVTLSSLDKNTRMRLEDTILIESWLKEKMQRMISTQTEQLEAHFASREKRFATPLKFLLQRLLIPRQAEGNLMPTLERSIALLNDGQESLQTLAQKHQGQIQKSDWLSVEQLNKKTIASLNIGEHLAPYTTPQFYIITKMVDRQESEIQPLSAVKPQVIEDYIQNNSADLYNQIKTDIISKTTINQRVIQDMVENL